MRGTRHAATLARIFRFGKPFSIPVGFGRPGCFSQPGEWEPRSNRGGRTEPPPTSRGNRGIDRPVGASITDPTEKRDVEAAARCAGRIHRRGSNRCPGTPCPWPSALGRLGNAPIVGRESPSSPVPPRRAAEPSYPGGTLRGLEFSLGDTVEGTIRALWRPVCRAVPAARRGACGGILPGPVEGNTTAGAVRPGIQQFSRPLRSGVPDLRDGAVSAPRRARAVPFSWCPTRFAPGASCAVRPLRPRFRA